MKSNSADTSSIIAVLSALESAANRLFDSASMKIQFLLLGERNGRTHRVRVEALRVPVNAPALNPKNSMSRPKWNDMESGGGENIRNFRLAKLFCLQSPSFHEI